MKSSIALVVTALAVGCGPSRTLQGTLAPAHPSGTVALAFSASGVSKAPVGADGRFSLTVPAGSSVRVRFAAPNGAHLGMLGTLESARTHRVVMARTQSTRALSLGTLGTTTQEQSINRAAP